MRKQENSATLDDPLKSNQPFPKSKPIKPKVLLISTSIRKKVIPELLSSLSKLNKIAKKLAYTNKTILNYKETAPDAVVLHHMTNDIETKCPEMRITEKEEIIC